MPHISYLVKDPDYIAIKISELDKLKAKQTNYQ